MTRAGAALLAALLCVAPLRGFAAETVGPDPGALYREGKEAFDAGRLQEALAAFTRAHALSGLPELLINMAQCERGLGRPQEALRLFERFIAEAPDHRLRPAAERTLEELRAIPVTPADAPTSFTAEPTPKPQQTVPAQALGAPSSDTPPEPPAGSGGKTWLWVGLGVGAALVTGGVIYAVTRPPPPPPTIGTIELPPR